MTTDLGSHRLYIGGEWVDASGEDALAVINPATEEVIANVPQATVADVDRAVAAARRAFDEGPWPRMSPRDRSDALLRFVAAVEDRRADLVDLIIAEAGCARMFAQALQFDTPLRYATWFAERAPSSSSVILSEKTGTGDTSFSALRPLSVTIFDSPCLMGTMPLPFR